MTLAELIAAVYGITNRPDLVALTATAIQSATLKAHHSDVYHKDMYETGVAFTSAEYIQDFEYAVVIPRWRSISYVRKWDNDDEEEGDFFDIIDPANTLDDYGVQRDCVAYFGGDVLHLRSVAQFQHILIGCYRNPDITEGGYNSWIARDHPFAVVYDAAATVFKAIGKKDEFSANQALVSEQLIMLRNSNIQGVGY